MKRTVHVLFFSYSLKRKGIANSDLVVINTGLLKRRRDYYDYINNFIKQCSNCRPVAEITIDYVFSPLLAFRKLFFIIRNLNKAYSLYDLIQLSQLFFLHVKLHKQILRDKSIVTFCDAHPEDNLIAQVCGGYFNCSTYTLQHGYYTYSPGSINQEVYENFISDYMLCWGDISKNNLIKIGIEEKRLISFGCFKRAIDCTSGLNNKKSVLILLNGIHNNESNKYLLDMVKDILSQTDYHVLLKKHPDDKNQYFLDDRVCTITSLKEGVVHSDFAILTESGVFVDLYLSKHPFFILETATIKPEYKILPNLITSFDLLQRLTSGNARISHIAISSLIKEHIDFMVI